MKKLMFFLGFILFNSCNLNKSNNTESDNHNWGRSWECICNSYPAIIPADTFTVYTEEDFKDCNGKESIFISKSGNIIHLKIICKEKQNPFVELSKRNKEIYKRNKLEKSLRQPVPEAKPNL